MTTYSELVKRYGSQRKASEATGIPRTTLQRLIKSGEEVKKTSARSSQDPELKATIKKLDAEIAAREKAEAELKALLALKDSVVPTAKWQKQKKIGSSTLLPVLFCSDMHCGEVIRPEDVDGLNEYNVEIFRQRYQRLIDKSISLSFDHTGCDDFPGIIYLRGGDAISGDIHLELIADNELSSIPAIRECFQQEREGIKKLAEAFGKVHVISVPGNHDRISQKPMHSNYFRTSLGTMLSWWLESSFIDDDRITFHTPASGDAYFNVLGWKVLMNHGDRMGSKGGMGFVGPAATIARGHWKLYDNWTRTGRPVDLVLTAHLHTSLKLERGYANGSLAGFSCFARDMRALPAPPTQWLLFFNRDICVADAKEVVLDRIPNRTIFDSPNWSE